MGALTKTVAPGLAGGPDSGSTDLLHMIMGSHAAGQGGLNPLLGLFGGIHSLASGGEPHTASSLHDLIQQMGLQVKPPQTMGGPAAPGFGMNPQSMAPMMNPQMGAPVLKSEPQQQGLMNPNLKKPGLY